MEPLKSLLNGKKYQIERNLLSRRLNLKRANNHEILIEEEETDYHRMHREDKEAIDKVAIEDQDLHSNPEEEKVEEEEEEVEIEIIQRVKDGTISLLAIQ